MSRDWPTTLVGLRATGADAREASGLIGWEFRKERAKPEFAADWVTADSLWLARFWLSPGELATVGAASAPDEMHATMVVEGRGTILLGKRAPQRYGVGTIIFAAPQEAVSLSVDEPTGLIHIGSLWTRLVAPGVRSSLTLGVPFAADGVYSRVLAAMINNTISAQAQPDDPAFPHLRRALDAAMEAVLAAHTGQVILREDSRKRELFEQAVRAMGYAAHDPSTTPATISRDLGISEKYLQAVFRDAGETPARHLRELRALRAGDLLEERAQRSNRRSLSEIAQMSGFSSTATMRRALEQHKSGRQGA